MHLYNISLIIEEDENERFYPWLQHFVTNTLPRSVKLLKLRDSQHDGMTYCIQYPYSKPEELEDFQQEYLVHLENHLLQHHNEKAFIFDSVMDYLIK